MKLSKIIFSIILSLILVGIGTGVYFYVQYFASPEDSEGAIKVFVVLDYGSLKTPKIEEYNITLDSGTSAYDAFSVVADLDVTNYSYGIYIQGVNGHKENLPDFWAFYYFDSSLDSWVYSERGVSNYILSNGDSIKLAYTG